MRERFSSSDSNAPSRREFILLAAGAVSATVAGALAADAQAASIVVPPATEAVSPFSISLPQTAIDDLRHRLDSTRYPERETVGDWTQGVPLDKARALIAYWRDRVDRPPSPPAPHASPPFPHTTGRPAIHLTPPPA